jgi:transposase-like protein
MSEIDTELVARLVTGRKRDGRRTYDPQAKAQIVQACLQPGVSVARIAMQYGINANLLRTWLGKRRDAGATRPIEPTRRLDAAAAFVPLQLEVAKADAVRSQGPRLQLHVRLPNGVEFDLGEASLDELPPVLRILGAMSCSGSTNR